MNILDYWNTNNFDTSSYKWGISERKNKIENASGTDDSGLCTYTYNELGFRSDSIYKEGFKILSLGCSLTEGVGVDDTETWPAQLCKYIPNSVNLNFGTGGRSNDYITRCLISYFDLIKPDLVLVLYTYKHRRELYTNLDRVESYVPGKSWGYLKETFEGQRIQYFTDRLQNDNEDTINWYKNHLLISNFLENKKVPFVWNGSLLRVGYKDTNQFMYEYSPFVDIGKDNAHPGPIHNKLYSTALYKHILNKGII